LSCSRNHRRYTLCGYHHAAGHAGDWRECTRCREEFETEMYVYYGTNAYNFVKLEDVPEFQPTLCSSCGKRIDLGNDGYSIARGGYYCSRCSMKALERRAD
jgi:DNA-directed RNA polymerase subunit RPC12/RpoP